MRDIILNNRSLLLEDGTVSIFQEQGIDDDNDVLTYGKYEHETLVDHYMTLQTAQFPGSKLDDMKEKQSDFREKISDPFDYDLPKLKKEEGDIVIETKYVEETFHLLHAAQTQDINISPNISLSIQAVNDDAFYLHVYEETDAENHIYHMFIKQDFSDITIVSDEVFAKEDFVASDKFKLYEELFPKVDDKRRYLESFEDRQFIDIEKTELQQKGYFDYLSKDGKYTYLHSDNSNFSKGTQEIQCLDDRIQENDKYYAKFRFSYRNVINKLNWPIFGSSEGKIVYFSDDIVMLQVSYSPLFKGDGGRTNVIIDLQEDKENPDIYLIDLGVSFKI